MQNKKAAESMNKIFANTLCLNRIGTKKEIADMCLYLASDAASFVTGDVIYVDGGER